MALQIRRGLEADRLTITPSTGELIYTTDSKLVYVGDGATAGGTLVTGGAGLSFNTIAVSGQPLVVADSSSDTLNLVAGSGVSITTNSGSDTITISNSGLLNVIEDTTPQLGGNLDVSGYQIITSNNNNITLNPDGTGEIYVNKDLRLNASIVKTSGQLTIKTSFINFGDASDPTSSMGFNVTRNGFSATPGAGINFSQHHTNKDVVNFNLSRSRGTSNAPTQVEIGDDLGDIAFVGHTGTSYAQAAVISAIVEQNPVHPNIATFFRFETNNGSSFGSRAELSSSGVWKVNKLSALTGSTIELNTSNSLSVGDVRLNQNGLSTINSNADLTLSANGTGQVNINSPVSVLGSNLKLSGIPTATRDLLSASNGMLIYNSDLNKFQGYENGAWVNLI